jgi:Flp pilus assembly protein TadG
MLVLLVPVMLGIMGFAVDLGRLYLIRGELTHAAEAMAIAAASKLIGTETGLTNATAAAQATLDDTTGHGNKYNFGSLLIGGSTDLLTSTVSARLISPRRPARSAGHQRVRLRQCGRLHSQVRTDQSERRRSAVVLGHSKSGPGS